jgi:NACalpha-BTF3-like transcription factor
MTNDIKFITSKKFKEAIKNDKIIGNIFKTIQENIKEQYIITSPNATGINHSQIYNFDIKNINEPNLEEENLDEQNLEETIGTTDIKIIMSQKFLRACKDIKVMVRVINTIKNNIDDQLVIYFSGSETGPLNDIENCTHTHFYTIQKRNKNEQIQQKSKSKVKLRGDLIAKIMKEKNLSLGQASKYIKENKLSL